MAPTQVDDSSTVSSVDDIVSRTKLKMSSEMQIAQKSKDSKPRKKRVVKPKQKPLSPAQTQGESTKQTAPPPAISSSYPATPNTQKKNNIASPASSQKTQQTRRDDPMDRVTTFLTEMPLLE